eukprot:1127346-Amphidinium_carterae.2
MKGARAGRGDRVTRMPIKLPSRLENGCHCPNFTRKDSAPMACPLWVVTLPSEFVLQSIEAESLKMDSRCVLQVRRSDIVILGVPSEKCALHANCKAGSYR